MSQMVTIDINACHAKDGTLLSIDELDQLAAFVEMRTGKHIDEVDVNYGFCYEDSAIFGYCCCMDTLKEYTKQHPDIYIEARWIENPFFYRLHAMNGKCESRPGKLVFQRPKEIVPPVCLFN